MPYSTVENYGEAKKSFKSAINNNRINKLMIQNEELHLT